MPSLAPRTITFSVWGPIKRADVPGLCARVCAVLTDARNTDAYCDVSGVPADAVTVEALALLQLAAKRSGCRMRLRNSSPDLMNLVLMMGLRDVLPA
jgi:hypothetical protein